MGLALLGRERTAYAWLAGTWLVVLMGLVWPPLVLVGVVAVLASAVHALVYALRSDAAVRAQARGPAIVLFVTLTAGVAVKSFVFEGFRMPSSSMYPTLEIDDHFMVDKLTGWGRGDVIVHVYPCEQDRDYVKRIVGLPGDTVEVRCGTLYVNGKAVPSELVDANATYDDHDDATDQWFPRSVSRYRETLDGHSYDVFHPVDHDPSRMDARDFPRPGAPSPSCGNTEERGASPPRELGRIVTTNPGDARCQQQVHYVVPKDQVFVLGDNRSNSNDSRVWGGVPIDFIKGRVRFIWKGRSLGRIGTVR